MCLLIPHIFRLSLVLRNAFDTSSLYSTGEQPRQQRSKPTIPLHYDLFCRSPMPR